MNINNKKLCFVILIGGKSVRFGSDKGIYEYLGKPLISYQLEILRNFDYNIFLIAHDKKQIKNYMEKIDYRLITAFILDDLNDLSDHSIRSPLIGIYSALKELKNLDYEKAFILSCDMPLIKKSVIELIIKGCKNHDCCIPRWNNGYLEPLFAIYPISKTFLKAKENLQNSNFKLTALLDDSWKINYISIEEDIKEIDHNLLSFININGPIDLKKLNTLYKNGLN